MNLHIDNCDPMRRRGNALILVAGILVLLVLVATAFLTRTRAARMTASAQQVAGARSDNSRVIAKVVADEIAASLFANPLVASQLQLQVPRTANAPRNAPSAGALRYGHDPNNPFNFAPYRVLPWTNPPDLDWNGDGLVETGPDNPLGGPSFGDSRWLRDIEPQRGDFFDQTLQVPSPFGQGLEGVLDGVGDTFTHWRHMTNLSRSNNAWRVCYDISDVGTIVTDLEAPIEQWPAFRPQRREQDGSGLAVNLNTGFPTLDYDGDGLVTESDSTDQVDPEDATEFWARLGEWATTAGWRAAQDDPALVPNNFFDLSDLDGDGVPNERGERPRDGFVTGTPRWHVERILTDTDGDGFTDAFWHLSPYGTVPGTRQIVAVSITDNSGRLNANTATRFHRKDHYADSDPRNSRGGGTRGQTPADVALTSQCVPVNPSDWGWTPLGGVHNWSVGFLDALANRPGHLSFDNGQPFPNNSSWVSYDAVSGGTGGGRHSYVDWKVRQWSGQGSVSVLDELGIEFGSTPNPVFNDGGFDGAADGGNPTNDITSRRGRMWYWQLAGRKPMSASEGLTPFSLSDEMELRICEGNNYQFAGSRFERSLNDLSGVDYAGWGDPGAIDFQFLRSDWGTRHEAGELRDQNSNDQLLFDNRRKLTLFSNARNDLLPPWLRWEERFSRRYDPSGVGLPAGFDAFDYNNYAGGIIEMSELFPLRARMEAVYVASHQVDVNNDQQFDSADIDQMVENFREQSREKADLREYFFGDFSFPSPWWESVADGRLTLAERAPLAILLALSDMQEIGLRNIASGVMNSTATTGFFDTTNIDNLGNYNPDDPYQQARLVSAGLASNMLAYRDGDDEWRMHSKLPDNPDWTQSRSDLSLSAALPPPALGRQMAATGNANDLAFSGPNASDVHMLGMEAQPFILEAFLAHVYEASQANSDATQNYAVDRNSPQETIAALQIVNPFDREILLDDPDSVPPVVGKDYVVSFFGQPFTFNGTGLVLPPGTPENPSTLILYSIAEDPTIDWPSDDTAFRRDWLNFLDLDAGDHPTNTQIIDIQDTVSPFQWSQYGTWDTTRATWDVWSPGTPGAQPAAITANAVTIARYDTGINGGNLVLIDRLDHDATTDTSLRRLDDVVTGDQEFELAGEWTDTQIGPIDTQDHFVDLVRTNADDLNGSDMGLLVQWIRATRAWAADIPDGWGWPNQTYDGWERNPRFIFSQHDLLQSDNTLRVGYYEEDMSQIPPRLNQKWETDPLKGVSVIGWDPDTENPDDQDNDGNPDGVDVDLLADAPDPWIVTESWSPRAGDDLRGLDADGDGTGTDANGFESPDGLPDGGLRLRKPTYFDMNRTEDPAFPAGWSYPDKGWYGQRDRGDGNARTASDDPAFEDLDGDGRIGELELPSENLDGDAMFGENELDMPTGFPLQMLQKDGDFDQVGELLNCWLLGHMLEGTYNPTGTTADVFLTLGTVNAGTVVTFSEFMMPMSVDDWWAPIVGVEQDYDNDGSVDVIELDARVNRLRFAQDGLLGYPLMPGGTADINGALDYPWPRMSAAARVLDSFVCDGPGRPDTDGDGLGDDLLAADAPVWSFYNANGFNGEATPGLININTAPLEVIRALPHMYKMVHQTDTADAATLDGADRNPRTAVAEAIVQWRENGNGRANIIGGTGITGGPDYANRNFTLGIDTTLPIEETRGFHSPAQIGNLTAPGQADDVYEPWHLNQQHQAVKDRDAWRIDFAARNPFADPANTGFWIDGDGDGVNDDGVGAHLSTDVVGRPYSGLNTLSGDMVSGDSEEINLLLSGMSNLITTTSDMFTVHMRIRTFKRNPVSAVWDATDPEYIIDDSRYVMLVDRSRVNHPNDQPKILYFEKLPN